jgi:hypothetical protein
MPAEQLARRIVDVVQTICEEHYGRQSQILQERVEVPWNMLVQLAKAVVIEAERGGKPPEAFESMGGEAAFNELAEGVLSQSIDDEYNLKFHMTIADSKWLTVWNFTYLELMTRNDRAGKPPFGRWPGLMQWPK